MGLSPRSRKLLDAYREHESLPAEKAEDLLQDLTFRIARGEIPSVDIAPSSVKISAAHVAWSKLPILLPFLVGMGAMSIWFLHDRSSHDQGRTIQAPSVPESSSLHETVFLPSNSPLESSVTTSTTRVTSDTEDTQDRLEAPKTPRAESAKSRHQVDLSRHGEKPAQLTARRGQDSPLQAPKRIEREASTLDGIEAEMRMMKRAHELLRTKRPLEALSVLQEHSTRFPRGKLADSRALTRVLALCQSGQEEVARAEAAHFPTQFPHSPFAGRVRAACPMR